MRLVFLAALLTALLSVETALAWETITPHKATAYVLRVEEGNLIAVTGLWGGKKPDYIVSRYGIGMPTVEQPFGREARAALLRLLPPGAKVILSIVGAEAEGVVSALVQVEGRSVNNLLVADGLAWVDRSTCKAMLCRRWHIQEHSAITERRGVWSLNLSSPPWQWGAQGGTLPRASSRRN